MPLRLDDLRPNEGAQHRRKRVGRGTGSGRGKTAGRGMKGQKARGNVRPGFEGGQLPIQQRLPYKRGFTNIYKAPWEVVNLDRIAELDAAGPVTPELLFQARLIRGLEFPVKILGDGELDKPLVVSAHAFSASAKERIESAGGTVVTLERTDRWVNASPRSRRLPLNSELKAARVGKTGGPSRAEALAARREQEG